MRMENVKIGKFLDDEGNQISDVEKVLNSLDVELRDNNLQFRNMGEVLEDTMVVWKQLGAEGRTVEQQMIAVAFAGQRQSNIFTALMNDQDKYNEALKIEAESLGLVEQRYTIFTDNIEANKNRFKASWEEMWSTTITDESIINITKFGTAVLNLISNMGGLIPVVGTLTGLFVTLRNVSMASGLAFTSILGPIGLIIAAVSAVSAAFNAFHRTAQEIQTDFNSTVSQYNDSVDELERLKNAYIELSSKQSKNADDLKELLDIQSTVVLKYGAAKEGVDLYTDAVHNNSAAIRENIKWLEQQNLKEAERFLKINKEDYEKALKYLNQKQYVPGTMFNDYKGQELSQQEYLDYLAEVIAKGNDTNGVYRKQYDTISENLKIYQEIVSAYREYYNLVNDVSGTDDPITRRGAQEEYGELSEAIESTAYSLEELVAAADASSDALLKNDSALASIMSDYEEYGQITLAQANQMIAMGYAEALMIDVKTGKLGINVAVLHNLVVANAMAAASDAQMAYAAAFAIAPLDAETNALWKKWQALAAIASLLEQTPMSVALPSFSGGGFSGGGVAASQQVNVDAQEAEIDAINEQIDALHDQQDALKDLLKAYKDIIDAQKEKLRLAKEEDDYQKALEDKNKELVDIDNELLALQFDNSQEANRKRLELEELRAEKAEEIAELQADRTYDIQMEALDAEYAAYEEWINNQLAGIDRLIEGFNAMIEAIRDVIEALQDMNNQSGGGGGYSGGGGTSSSSSLPLPPRPGQTGGGSGSGSGGFIYGSGGAVSNNSLIEEGFSKGGMGIIPDGHPNDSFPLMAESGEMFMIFNKQQQQQLARGARIPNMGIGVANSGASSAGITVGDISISVAGNLDKVALGDIKTAVFDVLNSASNQRGKRANALTYSL